MRRFGASNGFTLVEVLIATTLLMMAWLATARLFTASIAAVAAAKALTRTTFLATEKMEQLRALPIDDPALARSPPGALSADVDGFFDRPAPGYARRWSIEPLPSHAESAVAIEVQVVRTYGAGDAHIATIKTRKAY